MKYPEYETELFSIIANYAPKGALVMSYSAEYFQNIDLIKEIKNQ